MLPEALEKPVDQPGLRQRLAKQPDRGGIRYPVLEFQIKKAMNDMRSRIRYSVCSSERLCSDCSTTILNFRIAS
jgi:hypothetical protein